MILIWTFKFRIFFGVKVHLRRKDMYLKNNVTVKKSSLYGSIKRHFQKIKNTTYGLSPTQDKIF